MNDISVEVFLPPNLQPLADNRQTVSVDGQTISACLESLVLRFPPLKERLLDLQGELARGLSIYLNGTAYHSLGLDSPVCSGDKIYIINLAVGG